MKLIVRSFDSARHFLMVCALARKVVTTFALWAAATVAIAQSAPYPSQSIKFVIPFGPGGGGDLMGRLIAEKASIALKTPVVVENKTGASGMIGAKFVVDAKPDGYTILIGGSSSNILAPLLMKKPPFETPRDLQSLGTIGTSSIVLVARDDFLGNSLRDIKPAPGAEAINFASWGEGSSGHLCGVIWEQQSALKLQHVPFGTASATLNALLGRQVDLAFVDEGTAVPFLKAGKIKALAACTEGAAYVTDVHTYSQQGINFNEKLYWAMYMPKATPPEIVAIWSNLLREILAQPDVKERLLGFGVKAEYLPTKQHQELLTRTLNTWRTVIMSSGIDLR